VSGLRVLANPDQEGPFDETDKSQIIIISLALVFLALPLVVVHGAGGELREGHHPKGELVVGATVTVVGPRRSDQDSRHDDEGRYKIEGLKAGVYTVTISARALATPGAKE